MVGTLKTNSVAMAVHRSQGATGSPRPARASRTVAITTSAAAASGVTRLILRRRPSSSRELSLGLPTVHSENSSRVVPMSSGTVDAEPEATPSSGGRSNRPPSITGITGRPESSISPCRPSSSSARTSSSAGTSSSEARVSATPRRAALDDGPVEQTLGSGCAEQGGHAHPTGRFAEEGHLARIAAERSDVVPHPTERGDLVGQPPVPEARPPLAVQPGLVRVLEHGMGEEAEQAQPVVDGDHHHVALARQPPPSVHTSGPRSRDEGTAVDPH